MVLTKFFTPQMWHLFDKQRKELYLINNYYYCTNKSQLYY